MRNKNVLFLLIAVVCAGVAVYVLTRPPSAPQQPTMVTPVIPQTPEIKGKVLFSSQTSNGVLLDTFLLDLKTGEVASTTSIENSKVFHTSVGDAGQAVMVGTTKSILEKVTAKQIPLSQAFQIYKNNFNGSVESLDIASVAPLTAIDALDKRHPQLSPDGKTVLFMVKNPGSDLTSTTSTSTLAFSIYTNSTDTKQSTKLMNGAYPAWVTVFDFMYVAADGVHTYNIVNKVDKLVLPVNLLNNVKLAISHDRTMLALTIPDSGKVFLLKINSDMTLAHFKDIAATAFWSVFSPDDTQVLIQTQNATSKLPQIQIYSLDNLQQPFFTKELTNFNNESFFINDWVQ